MELRVCEHCYTGDHSGEKADIVQDLVECAQLIERHMGALQLTEVHITGVEEGEVEPAKALPAFAASLEGDDVRVYDTQLVMEDPEGNMLVYPQFGDMLEVLLGNLELIAEEVPDVSVDLSEASREHLE